MKEEVRELLGDPYLVYDLLKRHEAAIARFEAEKAKLIEEHPYYWVAVSPEGVVAWGDSAEGVMAEVRGQGLTGSDVTLEYLDPNPPMYIL